MGTAKGERRRQELVTAAAELLRSGGFEAVRHRAVAERAGLPLASTTYYFDSLDDLVTAAVERTSRDELAEGRRQLDRADDGAGPARSRPSWCWTCCSARSRATAGWTRCCCATSGWSAPADARTWPPLMRELRGELDALLTEILVRSGHPLDPMALRDLVSLVDGAVISALIEADPDPRAAAREVLLRTL